MGALYNYYSGEYESQIQEEAAYLSTAVEEMGLTYLFISHDLSVVRYLCDRIAVMYLGRIVEIAEKDELYDNTFHPYTKCLISSIPIPDPDVRRHAMILEGDVPSPYNPPSGCHFHTRCPYAKKECGERYPELREIRPKHFVACHFAEEIKEGRV